jgi:flagellar biogenesis protein FliO
MDMEMLMPGKSMEQSGAAASLADRCSRVLSAAGRIFAAALSFGRTQDSADNALRIEEKLSLGPKKMLFLVSCREKEFLIAAGADSIVSVVEVSSTVPAQAASPKKASLSRMQKRERLS